MFTIGNIKEDVFMSTISDRIIQRMTELKIRQVDLVEATGATKGAVSKWVAGTNIPKAEFLSSLANVLKTSQNWLLTGEMIKEKITSICRSLWINTD